MSLFPGQGFLEDYGRQLLSSHRDISPKDALSIPIATGHKEDVTDSNAWGWESFLWDTISKQGYSYCCFYYSLPAAISCYFHVKKLKMFVKPERRNNAWTTQQMKKEHTQSKQTTHPCTTYPNYLVSTNTVIEIISELCMIHKQKTGYV